jgi:magnesium-transporting ATPase (P-type)
MRRPDISLDAPHALSAEQALARLASDPGGLDKKEASERLARVGPNALPRGQPPTLAGIFLGQFRSPLIYVLLLAALISLGVGEWSDAGFIFAVLMINAAIGTFQEFSAERSAQALQGLVSPRTRVLRRGETVEIDAIELVPGDVVLLESGTKVPADTRLLAARNLSIDESLLTGESLAAEKDASARLEASASLGDRTNMAFAGSLVNTGRARGLVTATGAETELGRIATSLLAGATSAPPLIVRMEKFTRRIAVAVAVAATLVAMVQLGRGTPMAEIFLIAVALAVSAIPEGLPVAVTVALAVGMRRMARRAVIVRRLVAMEALGSCTCIASDKTGTLTVNQLTARLVQFPDQPPWEITGEGLAPDGLFLLPQGATLDEHGHLLKRLCLAVTLANDATLAKRDGDWTGSGDSVDLALLTMAHKAGVTRGESTERWPEVDTIPYESERRYAASLNGPQGGLVVSAKGALEAILPMCSRMATGAGEVSLDADEILAQARELAGEGYRVLAIAYGQETAAESFGPRSLQELTFAGLVAMSDPPRAEARDAIIACHRAGIRVTMITGDHPVTASVVARDLDLATRDEEVITGADLAAAKERNDASFDDLTRRTRVFARVEPEQKLDIVRSLQRNGHFVAVTGDGVNDAPALRAAEVGVAMGERGTDVARETADIILTDDNFASIVAGVEEGRIAYANIRKVIFLLISTGAAEVVLFLLGLIAGLPLPLLAVQLLWLNLVTNGIQDVALAFEPGEGDELRRPPRPPGEPVFDRVMIERVVLSALVIGSTAFFAYRWMLGMGWSVDEARNGVLLLMVLFENIQAFNSRSETLSVFRHNPMRNRLLLFGTLAAQLVHIGAMYVPGLNTVLGLQPVSLAFWLQMLGVSLVLLAAMEFQKLLTRLRPGRSTRIR